MSQEKTIKISPELFSLKSNKGKNKTLKNKGKERKPDIKINNAIKNKLIEKVKEYQKKNKDEIIEKKNQTLGGNNVIMNDSEYNEFEDSLNFLKILSDKNSKKKERKNNKTFKHLNESNVFVHNALPIELQEFNLDINKDNLESIKFNDPEKPYGCLKGGAKPTYRQWMKNTQKNKLHKELESVISKNKPNNDNLTNELIDKDIKSDLIFNQDQEVSYKLCSKFESINGKPENLENVKIEITNSTFKNEVPNYIKEDINVIDDKFNKKETNSTDYYNNTIDKQNLLPNEDINQYDKEYEYNQYDVKYDEFKINLHRNIKTLKYKLGKRKNKIGILIKNNKTLKKIKQDYSNLKKVPIFEIKQYLRKHNLIKVGCNAPNDVLRKMYESAILSGEIKNTNSENLLHNFLIDDQ